MQEDNEPKQPGPVATGWHCNKKASVCATHSL